MSALYDMARTAWPQVDLPRDVFERELAARAAAVGEEPSILATSDLYLALACARKDPAAIAAFEQRLFPEVARALGRLRLGGAQADDVAQNVRTKVLVGDGAPPRIATYSARGSLAGWLRAIAVHEALGDLRADARRGHAESPSVLERIPPPDAEAPELAHVRAMYAAPFKAAFAEALGSLGARDRNVLRLVYLDGLTAEQVGHAYGVHRVSVARWLGQIRESLFERTRATVAQNMHLPPSEFESVNRLCLSQIDVSLDRLLAELDSAH